VTKLERAEAVAKISQHIRIKFESFRCHLLHERLHKYGMQCIYTYGQVHVQVRTFLKAPAKALTCHPLLPVYGPYFEVKRLYRRPI